MKFALSLKLRILVLGVVLVVSPFLLQHASGILGLHRQVGLAIWALVMLGLTVALLGPLLLRAMTLRQAIVCGAVVLALGAGVYGYVAYVMVPDAITRANESVRQKR